MTPALALIAAVAILMLHEAYQRWRLGIRIKRLEHCVFATIKSGDEIVGLRCRCNGKDYDP